MKSLNVRRILMSLAAPVLALVVAFVVTSLVLVAVGDPVWEVWKTILAVPKPRQSVNIINAAAVFYLSAIAVAVGFRMNLFNIGVDGQYRVAVFAAAVFAGQAWLPGWLNVIVSILIAMVAGGLWASIAAYLKVKRGVSEVISTIMLNAIATGVVSWLLLKVADRKEGSNSIETKTIPDSSQLEGFKLIPGATNRVYTLLILAILVGFLYWFVLGKTRFGFDLRATGRSETAAVASGVKVPRMVMTDDRVRCAGGSGRDAAALRTGPQLRHDVPVGSRLRRHRHRAARPQQRRRDRFRGPSLGLPRRAVQCPADPGRRRTRARQHHPGRHPVRGRHRLRAHPQGRQASRAESRRQRARRATTSRPGHGRSAGMSATGLDVGTQAVADRPKRRRFGMREWSIVAIGAIAVISVLRLVTGADDIASSGALAAAIGLAVPIGLAGLGGLWSERAGVVNIGLEGMMILGTWGAGFFGYHMGPWAGVLGAILMGMLGGLIHAVATVTFGVDHIVSGVAINIIGLGVAKYLAARFFNGLPGGGPTQSPQIKSLPDFTLPSTLR